MLIVGDGLSNTVEKIGKMGRVWLRVEKINWRQPQTITLPVPPARELHAHRNGLRGPPQERSYRKAIHNTNRNNTKTPLRISWKYFTVCLRVQWKPSEEWKPFFQLNNGTVVQLKTCSAWLHSPTTSPDTATQSSGDSNKSFLWVQHFFHFSWEKVIFKVLLLIQKQVLFCHSYEPQQHCSLLQCDQVVMPRAAFTLSVTLNMLVCACIYCAFMSLYMRMVS